MIICNTIEKGDFCQVRKGFYRMTLTLHGENGESEYMLDFYNVSTGLYGIGKVELFETVNGLAVKRFTHLSHDSFCQGGDVTLPKALSLRQACSMAADTLLNYQLTAFKTDDRVRYLFMDAADHLRTPDVSKVIVRSQMA